MQQHQYVKKKKSPENISGDSCDTKESNSFLTFYLPAA